MGKLCSLNLLSDGLGRDFFGGGTSWTSHYLFLVVSEMRMVLFNLPSVLCQHYHCVFHLERMLLRGTVALGFQNNILSTQMIRRWGRQGSDY